MPIRPPSGNLALIEHRWRQMGAPEARQVADRFLLIQNLRDRIEQHLGGQHHRPVGNAEPRRDGADRKNFDRSDRHTALKKQFAQVHELYREGWLVEDISRHLGIKRRRVDKWVRLEAPPGTPANGSEDNLPNPLPALVSR